jgi:hypothetical protein
MSSKEEEEEEGSTAKPVKGKPWNWCWFSRVPFLQLKAEINPPACSSVELGWAVATK